jgi:lysophospholipid acyltransferase (LPLAT)-like uncharacterized protein
MNRVLIFVLGWLGAAYVILLRLTLRFDIQGDPRPALRAEKKPYAYAILHSQQLNFILVSDDVPAAAMVSGSKDGDMLVPACTVRSVRAVRGSTRRKGKEKGGREALAELVEVIHSGLPALLAIDGPKGPRNYVQWGIVDLARETGAHIVVAGVFPVRRRILTKTWDRTQLPGIFTTMRGRFRPAINPADFPDRESLRAFVIKELLELEREHDPQEAAYASKEALDILRAAGLEPAESAAPAESDAAAPADSKATEAT